MKKRIELAYSRALVPKKGKIYKKIIIALSLVLIAIILWNIVK